MLAFCFCCNSWCKWLLESPGSLSASGFNRLYPGCGRFFCLGFCVCVEQGNEVGKLVFLQDQMVSLADIDCKWMCH